MKFSIIRYVLLNIAVILLIGCATRQHNVKLSDNFWHQAKKQHITVASFKTPKPQLYPSGGGCGLLDLAIINVANKDLNNMLSKIDLSWHDELAEDFVNKLKKRNIDATIYSKTLDLNKKTREQLLMQAGESKVLTIELKFIGATRNYYGAIPFGSPEAFCILVGKLVDPKDKRTLEEIERAIKMKIPRRELV